MRIRITDVAREADVSAVTASRALTNPSLVASRTRDRVLAVARQLDYRPNRLARGLRCGKTQTIAVVTSDLTQRLNTLKLDMLQRELMRNGYHTLLLQLDGSVETDLEFLSDCLGTVDGLILCRLQHQPGYDRIGSMTRFGLPVVSLEYAGGLEVDTVTSDRAAGARIAVEHLVRLGHRDIALGLVSLPSEAVSKREAGFRAAMLAAGLSPRVVSRPQGTESYFEHGYALARQTLGEGLCPSAWVFPDDEMAIGAMRALEEAQLQVPRDVSVIGWDDSPVCAFVHPRLTSLAQPVDAMVSKLIDRLLRRLDGDGELSPETDLIAPLLVERESCMEAPPFRS